MMRRLDVWICRFALCAAAAMIGACLARGCCG